MSGHEHVAIASPEEDADSRIDMWSALVVFLALVSGFVLIAGSFDGAL